MIEGMSLDQLRMLVAVAEDGSFSAAGRRMQRAQSAISQAIANLEMQLGVQLFTRTRRYPELTEAGDSLLADARRVLAELDRMKARARGIAQGQEAELGLAVDVLFPIELIADEIVRLHQAYPATAIRLSVEALGALLQPVLAREASIAIISSLPEFPSEVQAERVGTIEVVPVAAPSHPLVTAGEVTRAELGRHIQLILTDRSPLTKGRGYGVFSSTQWRLADLGAKHALLRTGLGWGGMPRWLIADDLAAGKLAVIRVAREPSQVHLPVYAVNRADNPPGPVARALIERLKDTPGEW